MLNQILSTSFFVIGVYACMKEGFILSYWGAFVRELSEWNDFTKWVCKPLGTCMICMSSVYGIPFLWLNYGQLNLTIIVSVSGFIYFLTMFLNVLKFGTFEQNENDY